MGSLFAYVKEAAAYIDHPMWSGTTEYYYDANKARVDGTIFLMKDPSTGLNERFVAARATVSVNGQDVGKVINFVREKDISNNGFLFIDTKYIDDWINFFGPGNSPQYVKSNLKTQTVTWNQGKNSARVVSFAQLASLAGGRPDPAKSYDVYNKICHYVKTPIPDVAIRVLSNGPFKAGDQVQFRVWGRSNLISYDTWIKLDVGGGGSSYGSPFKGDPQFQKDLTFTIPKGASGSTTLKVAATDSSFRQNSATVTVSWGDNISPPPPSGGSTDTGINVDFDPEPQPQVVNQPLVVTDTSDPSSCGTKIVSETWSISPSTGVVGTLSGAQSSVTFSKAGDYTITLTAKDDCGKTGTKTKTITITDTSINPPPPSEPPGPTNKPPVAKVKALWFAHPGKPVNIDGSGSYDPDNGPSPLSYDWKVSGGSYTGDLSGTGGTTTFDKVGNYTVKLTVDDGADTDSDSQTIEVDNNPPVAQIGVPSTVIQGDDIAITNSSYDPDGDQLVNVKWTLPANANLKDSATDAPVTTLQDKNNVYFDQPGTYTIGLHVEDEYGGSDDTTATVTVKPAIPAAYFTLAPGSTPKENRKMVFDATQSTSSKRYPIDWSKTEWEYIPPTGVSPNNIKVVSDPDLSHRTLTVKKAGAYTFRLRVTNSKGSTSPWFSRDIEISPDTAPHVDFYTAGTVSRDPDNGDKAAIYLTDESYSDDGDNISKRVWKYRYDSNNDGSFLDEQWVTLDSGNNPNPVLYTDQVGKYQFEEYVEETPGQDVIPEFWSASDVRSGDTSAKDPTQKTVEVINLEPYAGFSPIVTKTADISFINMAGSSSGDLPTLVNSKVLPTLSANKISASTHFYQSVSSSKWAILGQDSGWGMTNAWSNFLDSRKIPYDRIPIDQIGAADFSQYSHMVITGDQPSSFYSAIVANKSKLQNWVANGGQLFWERTDGGWNSQPGSYDGNMFGWQWNFSGDGANYIADFGSPITSGVSNPLPGSWASHGYFSNLPSGTKTILKDSSSRPVLIEFNYGGGHVIASGNPLEFYINGRGAGDANTKWSAISNNVINYMYTLQAGSISQVLNSITFDPNKVNFVVLVSDTPIHELDDPIQSSLMVSRLLPNNTYFVAIGKSRNQYQMQTFINKNAGNGTFILNNDINTSLNPQLTDYIINMFKKNTPTITNYVLLGDQVNYDIYYGDAENDPQYAQKWKYTQDPTVFENNLGYASYNNQWIPGPIHQFDTVGKFDVTFQVCDNPKDDNRFDNYRLWSLEPDEKYSLYVHRRPVADFKVASTPNGWGSYNVALDSSPSYDLDHLSRPDRGAVATEWKWMDPSTGVWQSGAPSTLAAGKTFLISLRVQDLEGAWSFPVVKMVNTAGLNMPPIAKFVVSPNPLPVGKYASYDTSGSYDPDPGDTIIAYQWSYREEGGSWSAPAPNPPNYPTTFTKENTDYEIKLMLEDNHGNWSDPYIQTLHTIPPNKPPVAKFTINPNPVPQDVKTSYTDQSWDPDGDPIVAWHWRMKKTTDTNWTTISSPPTDVSGLAPGDYQIQLQVRDQPKLPQLDPLWSNWYEQILTVLPKNVPPVANLVVSPNPGLADEPVTWIDKSTDPEEKNLSAYELRVTQMETGISKFFTNTYSKASGDSLDMSSSFIQIFEDAGFGNNGIGTFQIEYRVRDTSPNGLSPQLWSEWQTQTLTIEEPLSITGTITPSTAHSGETITLTASTTGRAQNVYVKVDWNRDGSLDGPGETIILTPKYNVTSKLNDWEGKVLVPLPTADGNYDVLFTATKTSPFDGSTKMATDKRVETIKGTIFDDYVMEFYKRHD